MSMLKKLISGGQTGADSCILRVGAELGIPTGGLVPKGWLTEQGPKPALRRYGFTESDSSDYGVRTCKNVENSDATLVFAIDPDSDGTRLTMDHAKKTGRPSLAVNPFDATAVEAVGAWLRGIEPSVLNVAGNRESLAPGIAGQAERVLYAALSP